MKLIRFISAILLCSTLFISCSNTETDEELQMLIENQKTTVDDSGGEKIPIPQPGDPENG